MLEVKENLRTGTASTSFRTKLTSVSLPPPLSPKQCREAGVSRILHCGAAPRAGVNLTYSYHQVPVKVCIAVTRIMVEEVKLMAYSPTMIANNVLSRAFAEKVYVSPMKLQKLLYFIASEYQKRTGKSLLAEPFQTWAYGPVVHSVYDEFRPFSKSRISRYGRDAQGKAYIIDEHDDLELRHSIDHVWEAAKNKGAVELSELTHREGSAWDLAFQEDRALLSPDEIENDYTYREELGISGAGSAVVGK